MYEISSPADLVTSSPYVSEAGWLERYIKCQAQITYLSAVVLKSLFFEVFNIHYIEKITVLGLSEKEILKPPALGFDLHFCDRNYHNSYLYVW